MIGGSLESSSLPFLDTPIQFWIGSSLQMGLKSEAGFQ